MKENGFEEEGREWIMKSTNLNYAKAQLSVGMWYGEGDGVEKNEDEAVAWVHKAADNGLAVAQYMMGEVCSDKEYEGFSIPEAKEWFAKAINNGCEEAREALDKLDKEYGGDKEYYISWWSKKDFGEESFPIKNVEWEFDEAGNIQFKNEIQVVLEENDILMLKDDKKGREFIRKFYDRDILENPKIEFKR